MRKFLLIIATTCLWSMYAHAQGTEATPVANEADEITQFVSAIKAEEPRPSLKPDSAFLALSLKQRLFYGYNFDIYYHHDTRDNQKNNGWSLSVTPELGYRISQRAQAGLRLGASYSSVRTDFPITTTQGKEEVRNLRIRSGSWEVTPYGRVRLKTLFNDKVGIWLEAHLYTGMEYPNVIEGDPRGTNYEGLKHTITYGAQLSPVITYQFNSKSTFQIFFSILSLGYSGSTFCYDNEERGKYKEYTNDLIIFSGKLRNLLSNQFTPGLYGLKFGVQKSF